MKKLILLSLAAFIIAISCEKTPEEIAVTSVTLSQATAEMIVGETVQLKETVLPHNATDKAVTWSSLKPSIAYVSESGLVTAVSEGTTTIEASAGGKSAFCQISVTRAFVDVSSVRLNTTELTLVEDEAATLTVVVLPEDATDPSIEWSSSDSFVASVNEGIVSAHKEGTAIITAKAGTIKAQCEVIVKPKEIAVSEITLNKNKLVLLEGEEETLEASVKPDNATDKTIIWTSSDESVARVSSGGKVSAIMGGAAIIMAQSGGKQAVCLVEVQKKIPVSSVTLNRETLMIEKGETETLVASVLPNDATDKNVTWTSSNPAVATVSNGVVEAISGGNATITASAGAQTATCDVTVIVSVKSIRLSNNTLSLAEGQSFTLTAIIEPYDATDKAVTWMSNNPEIAAVDNGKVTAMKAGSATITATCSGFSADCKLTIISESDLHLDRNVTISLTGTGITVSGGVYYSRTYTITNNSIVDIDVFEIGTSNYISLNKKIKAKTSYGHTLYFNYNIYPLVTVKFRYNGHEYSISGGRN